MVGWVLDEILKLLHPFMPFITEELWRVTGQRETLLALAPWPKLEGLEDAKAEAEIGWVIDLVSAIRSIKAEMNTNAVIPLVLVAASGANAAARRTLGRFHQATCACFRDLNRAVSCRQAPFSSSSAARWPRCRSKA